ncbi:winged helix DNA-binding domain-containing protein [Microbacterium sp. SD291]|uniref:winged helix DNA-binding domain-containing protein n=1 Tax=Microbacterium sp. SD291 TaxID=2782007 RepID=UPI001A96393D|nr:winged helix DNA-binding domain-containing protein [Microbacterium sp. SD291]MBO0982041.1 AlkZ family DNA glycosylase [Microbacterium sp. SD291]
MRCSRPAPCRLILRRGSDICKGDRCYCPGHEHFCGSCALAARPQPGAARAPVAARPRRGRCSRGRRPPRRRAGTGARRALHRLWSRVADLDPDDLGRRIAEMSLVRLIAQRATIHLHTVDDALAWRPLVQPTLGKALRNGFRAQLDGLDIAAVAAAGAALLVERPRPPAELGRALAALFPGRDPTALAAAVAYTEPVLQLPPRGVWGRTGKVMLAPVAHALGRPLAADPAPDGLILRYLRAFGPATTSDIRTFTGLTGIREIIDELPLRRFADERGRELLDVQEGPLPDPETPAPPRFLGEFDNLLLGHEDRTRVLPAEHRAKVLLLPARPLLVDGMAAGIWTSGADGIVVRAFEPIRDEAAVIAEGERMLAVLWQQSERTVRIEAH